MRDRKRNGAVDLHEHSLRNPLGCYFVLAGMVKKGANAVGSVARTLLDRHTEDRRAKTYNRAIEDDNDGARARLVGSVYRGTADVVTDLAFRR